jgi:hypothetical protein
MARDALPVSDRHASGLTTYDAKDPGEVRWVEIDVGAAAENADHMLGADELLRVAMARQ